MRYKYDPLSPSCLTWVEDPKCGHRTVGDPAGSLHPDGYWILNHRSGKLMVHRAIYEMVTGTKVPDGLQVDHINRNRSDNRFENLRLVTPLDNCQNKGDYANNTSGAKGVSFDNQSSKWRAFITVNKKRKWLGRFTSFELAKGARLAAEANHYRIAEEVLSQ